LLSNKGAGIHDWHKEGAIAGAHAHNRRSKKNKGDGLSPIQSSDCNSDDSDEFAALCPEELEEAADILVGGVEWLKEDVVIFARLRQPLDLRLERNATARFFAVIIGPPRDSDCVRHREMAEALASMLQDEEVVAACYTAEHGKDILDAFDMRMHKLTLMPHIHVPTAAGIKKTTDQMHAEMAQITGTDKRQLQKWDKRAEDINLDEGTVICV
jgi:hypothetical protein